MPSRSTWVDEIAAETLIVHCRGGGSSIKGLRHAIYDDSLVLRDAILLDPAEPSALDGLVVLERASIEFVQVIGGSA